MLEGKRIAAIIPALDEAENITQVISSLPRFLDRIIVVDNGSCDGTAKAARCAGAHVVREPRRGYGSACLAGIRTLEEDPPWCVVFLDGDGSDDPEQVLDLVLPVVRGRSDLVLASRSLGSVEPGALTPVQRFGNILAPALIRLVWGVTYTDLGPFRAVGWQALSLMEMSDPDFGWTVEMQIKAARFGLRVEEIPARYRRRRQGRSKVSGTVAGSIRAGMVILRWIFVEALRDSVHAKRRFRKASQVLSITAHQK